MKTADKWANALTNINNINNNGSSGVVGVILSDSGNRKSNSTSNTYSMVTVKMAILCTSRGNKNKTSQENNKNELISNTIAGHCATPWHYEHN